MQEQENVSYHVWKQYLIRVTAKTLAFEKPMKHKGRKYLPFLGELVALLCTYQYVHSKLLQLCHRVSHVMPRVLGVLRMLVRGTKWTDAVLILKRLVEIKNYSLCCSSRACFYYGEIKTSALAYPEHRWTLWEAPSVLQVCTGLVKKPWGEAPSGSLLGHSNPPWLLLAEVLESLLIPLNIPGENGRELEKYQFLPDLSGILSAQGLVLVRLWVYVCLCETGALLPSPCRGIRKSGHPKSCPT